MQRFSCRSQLQLRFVSAQLVAPVAPSCTAVSIISSAQHASVTGPCHAEISGPSPSLAPLSASAHQSPPHTPTLEDPPHCVPPRRRLIVFLVVYNGVVANMNMTRFVRFNAMQAVMLDVLLMCVVGLQHVVGAGGGVWAHRHRRQAGSGSGSNECRISSAVCTQLCC